MKFALLIVTLLLVSGRAAASEAKDKMASLPVSEPVIKSRALNPDANDFLYNPIRNEEDRMPALINKKIIRIKRISLF